MNLVQEIAASFKGQTFTIGDIADTVQRKHPDLFAQKARSAWTSFVRSELRRASDDESLPFALSVDDHGTYRQLSFMDVDEYRFTIARYMRQSVTSRRRAYRLADECKRVHGVEIDPVAELSA